MNEKEIRELVHRFMSGDTDAGEEMTLYRLFDSGRVPQDLLPLRDMFIGLQLVRQPIPPRRNTRHILRWSVAAAAAIIILIAGALSVPREPEPVPNDAPLSLAELLDPTADDTLRWIIDTEIDQRLAHSDCHDSTFMCEFANHSRLLAVNHDPQYVNNVLARLLAICHRDDEVQQVQADDLKRCINMLEGIAATLWADKSSHNYLGVGLCQQCIRALGGTPQQQT